MNECIWKDEENSRTLYRTACGTLVCKDIEDYGGKFCMFCGKPIKWDENSKPKDVS